MTPLVATPSSRVRVRVRVCACVVWPAGGGVHWGACGHVVRRNKPWNGRTKPSESPGGLKQYAATQSSLRLYRHRLAGGATETVWIPPDPCPAGFGFAQGTAGLQVVGEGPPQLTRCRDVYPPCLLATSACVSVGLSVFAVRACLVVHAVARRELGWAQPSLASSSRRPSLIHTACSCKRQCLGGGPLRLVTPLTVTRVWVRVLCVLGGGRGARGPVAVGPPSVRLPFFGGAWRVGSWGRGCCLLAFSPLGATELCVRCSVSAWLVRRFLGTGGSGRRRTRGGDAWG